MNLHSLCRVFCFVFFLYKIKYFFYKLKQSCTLTMKQTNNIAYLNLTDEMKKLSLFKKFKCQSMHWIVHCKISSFIFSFAITNLEKKALLFAFFFFYHYSPESTTNYNQHDVQGSMQLLLFNLFCWFWMSFPMMLVYILFHKLIFPLLLIFLF